MFFLRFFTIFCFVFILSNLVDSLLSLALSCLLFCPQTEIWICFFVFFFYFISIQFDLRRYFKALTMKCLDSFSLSLILAIITLIACILRASFLITVLIETTNPKSHVDPIINILLGLNTVAYLILALFTIPLIYGIVKVSWK